jgi:hypothetical protein
MNTNQKLPSDTLAKPTRRLPWILGGLATIALATGAVIAGPAIAANLSPAPTPSPTATEYVATLTPSEVDSVQQAADDQQATIAADEKAAADKAAADAAAAAAAAAAQHHASSSAGPVRCPAGSTANSSDGENDTSCFPNVCFTIPIPDPAHPECDHTFKP